MAVSVASPAGWAVQAGRRRRDVPSTGGKALVGGLSGRLPLAPVARAAVRHFAVMVRAASSASVVLERLLRSMPSAVLHRSDVSR